MATIVCIDDQVVSTDDFVRTLKLGGQFDRWRDGRAGQA